MNINSVIVAFILLLAHFILFTKCSVEIPSQALQCENKVKLNWLWNLRNDNRCLNIIIESTSIPKCFFNQIFNSKFLIKIFDLKFIVHRNVLSLQRTNCDNFMIFIENSSDIFGLFAPTNGKVQRFLPFSQLFVISADFDISFDENSLNYIYDNGLYMYMVKNTIHSPSSSNIVSFQALRNVLTEEILNLTTSDRQDVIRYFGSYKSHPFFNSHHKAKIFRVSLFNCAPYVIYLSDEKFDGLEYRILKEIVRDWTVDHVKCDSSNGSLDPWTAVLRNVETNVSDLAMCSVWLNEKSTTYYDASNYVDFQCGTFLVPKPKLLSAASFLYLSIGLDVWCALVVSLIVMSLCFTIIAKVGLKWMKNSWKDLVYVDFSRSLLDSIDLATSHGLKKYPKRNSMRILLNGWILVSFLVGVSYSTGYTSLLTKQLASKPIDTLVNFLDSDLYWRVRSTSYRQFSKMLIDSGVENYIQLAKRIVPDNDTSDTKVRVTQNGNMGVFVKIISNQFITDVDEKTDPNYNLRIMRSCFLNYYSVVALRKHSTYTLYFNEKIRMLQEFGIITHWGSSIQGAKNNYMRPYFKRQSGRVKGAPKEISLQNLSGAFWLLLFGLGIATMVLVTENLLSFIARNTK